jgi:hypothetical protein
MSTAHVKAVLKKYSHNGRSLTSAEIDWLVDEKLKLEDYENQPDEIVQCIAHNYLIYGDLIRSLKRADSQTSNE